jgi:recombinational DNA repair protein RecR
MDWIKEQLLPLIKEYDFKITELGRGISLGTEVEYTDKITIESALENRK